MIKALITLSLIFLLTGYASSQNYDPKNTVDKKTQYDKSKEKVEKQSEKEMEKQDAKFVHKKRYRKEMRKGKHNNRGKKEPGALILYADKKKVIV